MPPPPPPRKAVGKPVTAHFAAPRLLGRRRSSPSQNLIHHINHPPRGLSSRPFLQCLVVVARLRQGLVHDGLLVRHVVLCWWLWWVGSGGRGGGW